MLFRFISRLKFLIKSTNQHGIHSPFVYDFTTRGLYGEHSTPSILDQIKDSKGLTNKEKKVLDKIINYFNNQKKEGLTPVYISSILDIKNSETPFTTKNEYFIIKGIYERKETLEKWNDLIQKKLATVTIDLYYFGLIFIRPEQEKEHFIIRV